jgi:hypothetical protein
MSKTSALTKWVLLTIERTIIYGSCVGTFVVNLKTAFGTKLNNLVQDIAVSSLYFVHASAPSITIGLSHLRRPYPSCTIEIDSKNLALRSSDLDVCACYMTNFPLYNPITTPRYSSLIVSKHTHPLRGNLSKPFAVTFPYTIVFPAREIE